jgi:RNA polymerase sigma-70 factor, ECF subfamily
MGDNFAMVLAEAQAGREDYFAVLWRDANPALLRYLRVLAPEPAEDIAAETWVQVLRGLLRFIGDESAWRAWLFTTARRRLLATVGPRDLPRTPNTAQVALDNLATQQAIALLSQLPGPQAEVIMLRVVAGLDTDTVALMLGKTPGNVRVMAHRGLKRLDTLLGDAEVTVRPEVSDVGQPGIREVGMSDAAPDSTRGGELAPHGGRDPDLLSVKELDDLLTGTAGYPKVVHGPVADTLAALRAAPAELDGEAAARAAFRAFVGAGEAERPAVQANYETVTYNRPGKAAEVRKMTVSIYLSDTSVLKQVEAAVRQWLATADISIDTQTSPLWDHGSGSSRLSRKPSAHQPARKCS